VRLRALAPALLCVLAMTACLDPLLQTELDVPVNHPPVLSGVAPAPGASPISLNVGPDCAASASFRGTLDDLDEEELTIRWNLLVEREGLEGGARERLLELALAPAEERLPDGQLYDFRPFEITLATLRVALDPVTIEGFDGADDQLLELRISDGGFLAGKEEPALGAGFAFFSWAIRIAYFSEGCGS
jgi:hypothetical protein